MTRTCRWEIDDHRVATRRAPRLLDLRRRGDFQFAVSCAAFFPTDLAGGVRAHEHRPRRHLRGLRHHGDVGVFPGRYPCRSLCHANAAGRLSVGYRRRRSLSGDDSRRPRLVTVVWLLGCHDYSVVLGRLDPGDPGVGRRARPGARLRPARRWPRVGGGGAGECRRVLAGPHASGLRQRHGSQGRDLFLRWRDISGRRALLVAHPGVRPCHASKGSLESFASTTSAGRKRALAAGNDRGRRLLWLQRARLLCAARPASPRLE